MIAYEFDHKSLQLKNTVKTFFMIVCFLLSGRVFSFIEQKPLKNYIVVQEKIMNKS